MVKYFNWNQGDSKQVQGSYMYIFIPLKSIEIL